MLSCLVLGFVALLCCGCLSQFRRLVRGRSWGVCCCRLWGDDPDELESSRCRYVVRRSFIMCTSLIMLCIPRLHTPYCRRTLFTLLTNACTVFTTGFVCCVISDRSSPAGMAQAHTVLRATVVVKGCGRTPPPSPRTRILCFVLPCRGSMTRKTALLRRFISCGF